MANALIAYNNRIDAAALSLGSYVSTLPLANAKSQVLGRVARTVDLNPASTKFLVDCGTEKLARTFALVNHNCALDATVRVRASNNADGSSPDFDSGAVDVWPAVYNTIDLPFYHPEFWSGRYSEEERAGYTPTKIISSPEVVSCRYWLVEINDPNNTKGYVQFGRPFVGPAWQMAINMDYGASIGLEDPSTVTKSLSGQKYFDKKTIVRVARFTTSWLSEGEAFGNAFEIQRRMGLTGEIVFQQNPDDTIQALRRQFYGTMRALNPFEYPNVDIYSTAWEIEESTP